ncbi:phage portal protein [Oceanobacillus sp. J11TS1]|uniref:phage portal protein n=1 Tax=Oceanobacillus sp. J11TS1 TaxID=2807191 RepID=UPI001B26CF39|nr:phage-like protein [Oceanobacillus sp. J11TS1]
MIFRQALTPKAQTDTTDLKNPAPWFRRMFGHETNSGEMVTVNSALGVPAVYACVNILANGIATLPMQVFKRTTTGRTRDKKHAVAKLLETRPNPYQGPFKFKHLMETHRNLWGNAYVNIDWGADGRPRALWLLNPAQTEPIVDTAKNELWYHTTLPNGDNVKIWNGDVIHLTSLSTDGIKGKSPIQVIRESIGSAQAAHKFKTRFFRNGASMTGVLKVPGMLNQDAKDVVRDEWEKANTGLNNAQRVAILDAGLEYQSIQMPLKDAQFVESMKFDKTEIATFYNIPMHMVNELERSTHSNIEQRAIDFIRNTLSPIYTQYQEEFTFGLFSEREMLRYYIKFNLETLLRADKKTQAEFYEKMLDKGIFSINEVRELEERDGIENGDKHRVDLNHVSLDIADEYQLAKSGLKGGEDNQEE